MEKVLIKIKRLGNNHDIYIPEYGSRGSSGMDIRACVNEPIILGPGDIQFIPTGIAVSIPDGYECQIRPRSGLAIKNGIGLVNSPGTIDSDYRGEVGIILINWGKKPFTVSRGDRIAQMVVTKVIKAELRIVDSLDQTDRGEGGFGHSGTI